MEDLDPDLNLLDDVMPQNRCRYFTIPEFHNLRLNNSHLSLINYNIRSFHKNGPCFQSLIKSLNYSFKCFVLSETWNNVNNVQLCSIPGYDSFHIYRPEGHVYSTSGGISVFCDGNLAATKNSSLSICSVDSEICVVNFTYQKIDFTIVGIYRPPQGCKQIFISELDQILHSIHMTSRVVLLVGDFNINLIDYGDSNVVDFKSLLYSKNYFCLINKPTRFPGGTLTSDPSVLDMIWTNSLHVSSCGILDFDATDHLPNFCSIDVPISEKMADKLRIETRPFSDQNLSNLSHELSNINWDFLLNYDDVENCTLRFIEILNNFYQKCFPLKTKLVSTKRLQNKWITVEIKRLINQKSESFKKLRKGEITREANNRLKNKINSQIKIAKNRFYTGAFEQSGNNMKKTWNILGELVGSKKSKENVIKLLDESGEITEPKDIANKFAGFFSGVGQNLDSNLESADESPYQHVPRNSNSFYLFPVTDDECLNIIASLKLTSVDKNHIPVKVFKLVSQYLCYPIAKIVNLSFTHGIFPKVLKIAKITPIHKKNDKNVCSNYRPISCLPLLSKVFERLIANRITSFFTKFNLFSKKQYGFIKNRSTQDAVLSFVESVYEALDSRKHNISVLVDLKSAFDTVNHNILLKKLELYGFRGPLLLLLHSYLQDRQFQVRLGGVCSTKHTVNIGIPQGSILGPLLFIIYNNDLPYVSDKLSTTLFADDTNFSIEHRDFEQMVPILNSELSKIANWTVANRLTINTSKTEMLFFSNRPNVTLSNELITLKDEYVSFVNHARFLGVIIDDKMNFKKHINLVVDKLSKHAGILYKIKGQLTNSARITYYNSFILPYLSFNILHWGSTNDIHLLPLIKIQKRIVRTISDADFLAHTTPLFHTLKILKLKDLYKFQAVIDTHKKIQDGFYGIQHGLQTRNSKLALPKFHRLTRTQQSVTFNGPTLWNMLPGEIRNIDVLSRFKRKLKDHYLSQYGD